ncbi:MAG: hypothetical protein ABIS47_03325, partial [Acidimicrobiales bacterium]
MSAAALRRLVTLLAVAAAVAALVPGCNRGKVGGEGRLDPAGRVVLTRDDQPTTVTRSRPLVTGDTVEVAEGTAKVTLPGGDVLELRSRSILVLARGPDLRSGSMLVTTSGPARTVRATGSQVDASGATRIDVSLALRVVAYGGRAVVRSGGRTLEVPALREASVPVVGVLRGPRPLAIDGNDAWDRRLFGDAADREADIESRARGFTGQVAPSNASSVSYYRDLLPGLAGETAFQKEQVERLGRAVVAPAEAVGASRFRAGDVLLGAAVALQGRRGTFAERLAGATGFRAEGASWALIALDQQVPSIDDLLRLVDGAVNVAPLELAAPGRPVAPAVPEAPPARPVTAPRPTTPPTPSTTRPAQRRPHPRGPRLARGVGAGGRRA